MKSHLVSKTSNNKQISSMHKLDSFFNANRIVIVGVSSNPNSVSGKTLSNLVGGGFRGVVYPVNPEFEAVLGIPCYPDLQSLPGKPDLAVICTPPEQVPFNIRDCCEAGINSIIIMTSGFKETGEEGLKLENQIVEYQQNNPGLRIMGPNCLGIISPVNKLNVSFASGMPKAGNVAFVSQSGALCTSVLDWAIDAKIGFSHFISLGNSLDIDFGDIINYLGEDDNTGSIILYIESIRDARRFMSASRAFARSKPILVYKAGRFPQSAKVAASHTGAMASEDAIYDAAFRRAGMIRIFDIGEIFDCAELIGREKIPLGPRLGIITNAGGPGVMATDTLILLNGQLAQLSEKTMQLLNENLPPSWSHGNPVDVLGDARSKRIAKAAQIVLQDTGIDAIVVILTPQAMTNPAATAVEISKLSGTTSKPILASWLGGKSMDEGMKILADAGIASYHTPEQAIRAFMILVNYSKNLEILYETPKDIPVDFQVDRKKIRENFIRSLPENPGVLAENISKSLLESYSIKTTMPVVATNAGEAVSIANKMTYPVVLKIQSPDITHKSDVGGVILNINDNDSLVKGFNRIIENVSNHQPKARIEGVSIQKMADLKNGVEMILGIKKDNVFGTVIMVGMGGILAELYQDRTIGFPPLNEALARHMLESLKMYPLLSGYRGSKPKNKARLIETIIRMSYIAADYPEIIELDINPLIVTEDDVLALDARIVIGKTSTSTTNKPYGHLALQPYPEKYVKDIFLENLKITLRPIKPEDEPLWIRMLSDCSKESIYSRFRYMFHWNSHNIATKFCYIDYDREIAIVAELEEDGIKKLIGVGRLVADSEHETVEYAVLVIDSWQHKDLGNQLTDFCLDIAQKWELHKIVAQTTTDNKAMIRVFEKHGFEIHFNNDETIDIVKEL
ncbi:MAG: bifunctional acetate--CoA ligase family protein/GNAT family N-acetyltransferase [Bacteroidia bacterium]|nr:bifunctional acetate--CoA ligase family protein/GNAT family N-acetyltransferase [Bacteroidia bacterium]